MANSNEIAQIDEIYKGLTKVDGSLNSLSTTFLKIIKNAEDFTTASKTFTQTTENLNKAQKAAVDIDKEKDAANKALAQSAQKLASFDAAVYEQIQKNTKALADQKKAVNDKLKADEAEEGSLVRKRQKLSELTAAYDKTGDRTKAAAKEIDNLSREIGKAEAATNRHQRGVGGYADQLGKLPGPIGGVVSGLMTVGKAMWALVANPIGAVIAGIVAAFAALGSVFSSTASGGKFIKEVMASLGAIFDVLIERTMVVIDAFKMLFSGEFRKAADLFSKSVEGAGKQMDEAARAAWNLAEAQSQLNKELTFHVSEAAKENNEFQKALFISKDKTKSDQERLGTLKQALTVSEEMSKKEVEFAKRQYIIDTDKAALKAKTSGVTADQLRAFIELNTEEQKSALAGSAALQDMWNKLGGSDKFKPLEESYAKIIDADTEFFSKNKRTLSQMSTLENELVKEKEDRAKKIEDLRQKEVDAYVKATNEQIKSDEDVLNAKLKAIDEEEKARQDLMKQITDDSAKEAEDFSKNWEEKKKIEKDAFDEEYKMYEDDAKKKEELDKQTKQAKIDLAIEAGNAIFDLRKQAFENELSTLDKERNAALSNKSLTEKQKEKINADFDKKAAAIKTKQAKVDKEQALFNIAIGTAVSIMNAKGNIPLMILLGIMGAIQAAVVIAKPIPKFAKGTQNAPGEGIFGEAGRELMLLRSGEVGMADKATYFEGGKFKGAKIFSNPETERIIGASDRGIGGQSISDSRIIAGLEKLNTTIKNKPVIIQDKNHRQIGLQYSNSQEIYINRLTRSN
jgi:hypothetical protein